MAVAAVATTTLPACFGAEDSPAAADGLLSFDPEEEQAALQRSQQHSQQQMQQMMQQMQHDGMPPEAIEQMRKMQQMFQQQMPPQQ